MVFGSGKYHLTGGDSIEQIQEANTEFANIIESSLKREIDCPDPEIRNLVYRGEFDREFDLEALAVDLVDFVEYNPEDQPGLKYRSNTFSGLITVFRTGNFTITGAKVEGDAYGLIEEFQTQVATLMLD
jgi:transcription initiation factor TFIID TATA-box-binding protein